MSKRTKWHKGPPPSVGWWPARVQKSTALRWWNGEHWSWPCERNDDMKAVKRFSAKQAAFQNHEIEWTDRPAFWPKRSRT